MKVFIASVLFVALVAYTEAVAVSCFNVCLLDVTIFCQWQCNAYTCTWINTKSFLSYLHQTLEPKCPANYDMVQQEDGGCMCECLELVRCGGNKEWDREVCNCECNLMCDEGETLDEVACACRTAPTTPPTRSQIQLRGECTARASAPNPRDDCTSFLTFRECRKHGCQWTRGQNRGWTKT